MSREWTGYDRIFCALNWTGLGVDSPRLDFHGFLYFGFGFQSSSRYSHILNVAISLHSETRNIYAVSFLCIKI
jgi:hypothetical protein